MRTPTSSAPPSNSVGGSGGPGKFHRRLATVEAELDTYRKKCDMLEKWKAHVERWLFESFDVRFDDNGAYVDEGVEDINREVNAASTPAPTPTIAAPKLEETEDKADEPTLIINSVTSLSKKKDHKHGHYITSKRDLTNSSQPRQNVKVQEQKVPKNSKSSEFNKTSTKRPLIAVTGNSSVTVEVVKRQRPEIVLTRCNGGDLADPETRESNKPSTSSNSQKPVLPLPNHEETLDDDDDDISILYATPSKVNAREGDAIGELIHAKKELNIPIEEYGQFDVVETNDPTPCGVCSTIEPEPNNEMIFCEMCNLCVHQVCYGVRDIPKDGWKCSPCAAGLDTRALKCYFCPANGGAMKPIKSPAQKHWAHLSCALWIPEVKPENEVTMSPIVNISKIPLDRWKLKCSLCPNRQGACIQCQFNKRCVRAFHVTCAMKHGLEMKQVISDDTPDGLVLQAYCKNHTYRITTSDKAEKGKKKRRRQTSSKRPSQNTSPRKKIYAETQDSSSQALVGMVFNSITPTKKADVSLVGCAIDFANY